MAITGIGSNYNNNKYESNYAVKSNVRQQAAQANEIGTQAQESTRKTAADELAYLSKKYSNYSFIAANYSKGMQYGSSSTVNVAISPQFLEKMANDPKLEAEYEKSIAAMQKLDEQEDAALAGSGRNLVARGWIIDKDGGISKWCIVEKDDKKSFLQELSENAEKIIEKNAEKKKQQEDVEEKYQSSKEETAELKELMKSAGKEQFGGRFKEAVVLTADDEETNTGINEKKREGEAGVNFDIKL